MNWNKFYKKIAVNDFYFCYEFDTLITMKESKLNKKLCVHYFFATTLIWLIVNNEKEKEIHVKVIYNYSQLIT